MTQTVIIAGAGHAAGQAATSLRKQGFAGRIVLIGDEAFIPYQRPPLSKAYLAGTLELERLYFRPEKFYADHDVDIRLGTRVVKIDRDSKQVMLDSGEALAYDKLLLTTGSRVRELSIPGVDLPGVHYLRTIADVHGIQPGFKPGARMAIVGGGYIGLEVAAVAAKHGLIVTVLETEDRVMNRVLAPVVSEFFQTLHRAAGVTIEVNRKVQSIQGEDRVTKVICDDGHSVPTDICIIGIGILPNVELAADAGLECDNGIVVDEYCRTTDPDILAAGDCTQHPNAVLKRRLRLESVHNAIEQGKTAAATICGQHEAYAEAPWFWSDQYDIKLQIVGLSLGYDQTVVRGAPADNEFAVFYLREGKLLAVDAINSPREFMLGKKLVGAGVVLDAADIEALTNIEADFKSLATRLLDRVANA